MATRLETALRELEPTTFLQEEQERRRVRALDRALMRGRGMPELAAFAPSKPLSGEEIHYCPNCHKLHPLPLCARQQ